MADPKKEVELDWVDEMTKAWEARNPELAAAHHRGEQANRAVRAEIPRHMFDTTVQARKRQLDQMRQSAENLLARGKASADPRAPAVFEQRMERIAELEAQLDRAVGGLPDPLKTRDPRRDVEPGRGFGKHPALSRPQSALKQIAKRLPFLGTAVGASLLPGEVQAAYDRGGEVEAAKTLAVELARMGDPGFELLGEVAAAVPGMRDAIARMEAAAGMGSQSRPAREHLEKGEKIMPPDPTLPRY